MSTPTRARRSDPSSDDWRPHLLRRPDGARVRDVVHDPRIYRVTAIGLILTFLALQFLIPARLVITGMGAAGRPSVAVGILLIFLWAVALLRPKGLPARRQPIRWIVGAYLATQLVGYAVGFGRQPLAIEASAADRWMILNFAMAGVALAVADAPTTRRDLDRILRGLVALTAAMAAVGALQYLRLVDLTQYIRIPGLSRNADLIGQSARGAGEFTRVAGTANHYIEFGVVLALVLPLALHFAFFAGHTTRQRVLAWGQVALIGGAIPFSISRSAVLTALVSLTVLAMVWSWRRRYNVAVIAVVGLGMYHLVNQGLLGTIRSLFTNAANDPSIQNRLSDTAYVLELWQERPWLGRGAGMIIPEVYILLDNQFYVTLLAGGVLGVLVLAGLFMAPYFIARSIRLRTPREEDRHLAQALAAIFPAAMLATATFDSFFFATFVGVVFLALGAVGALWRLTRGRVPPGTPEPLVTLPTDRLVGAPIMAPDHPRNASRLLRDRTRE